MTSFKLKVGFGGSGSSFRSFCGEGARDLLGDGARREFEGFVVSVGRTAGFGFGFNGAEGVDVGLGIEEVTGVLALGRGMDSEDITRGRGLLGSMSVDDGRPVGGKALPENGGLKQNALIKMLESFPRFLILRIMRTGENLSFPVGSMKSLPEKYHCCCPFNVQYNRWKPSLYL